MNPCWLLLITFFHSLGNGIWNKLFHHLYRDADRAVRAVVSQLFILALFQGWNDIDVPSVLWHLSHSPLPFKDERECLLPTPSVLVVASHQEPWISAHQVCIRSSKGKSSIPQTLSLISRAWDSQGPIPAVKGEAKTVSSNSTFSVSSIIMLPTLFSSGPTFSLVLLLLLLMLKEAFLVVLVFPCQILFQEGLSLTCCIPVCHNNVLTLLSQIHFAINHYPHITFHRLLSSLSFPRPYIRPGLRNPRCRMRHLLLLNFVQLVITQTSSLSKSLCKYSVPSGSQKFLPVYYHPQTYRT